MRDDDKVIDLKAARRKKRKTLGGAAADRHAEALRARFARSRGATGRPAPQSRAQANSATLLRLVLILAVIGAAVYFLG
ncbi:hypothetical protein AQS8620_01520 [Aquimixticola soesokkakensis]|uniref:Cell division protein FtsQ n=1 Tax=Aquimixticola soesokkakensis TaxID=1519096 RepID=A0A1Y5SJ22_9RHOB|nr:hypothetical protein [Aquimixticola soesokkakensis]SLN40279.1 hypothetical protein AQS8620_01520 [Aquimixticola soesokkakensis]